MKPFIHKIGILSFGFLSGVFLSQTFPVNLNSLYKHSVAVATTSSTKIISPISNDEGMVLGDNEQNIITYTDLLTGYENGT